MIRNDTIRECAGWSQDGAQRRRRYSAWDTWNTGAGAQNMRKLGAAQDRFRQRLEQVQLHGAGGTASPHAARKPIRTAAGTCATSARPPCSASARGSAAQASPPAGRCSARYSRMAPPPRVASAPGRFVRLSPSGRLGGRAGRGGAGARRHQRPVHSTAPHGSGQRRRHRGANHRALRACRPCRRIDQARRTRAGDGQSWRVEVVTDGCPLRGGRRSRAGRRRYLPVAARAAPPIRSGAARQHPGSSGRGSEAVSQPLTPSRVTVDQPTTSLRLAPGRQPPSLRGWS